MIGKVAGRIFNKGTRAIAQPVEHNHKQILITMADIKKNDVFIRELTPAGKAREEVKNILSKAKYEDTSENIYCEKEINDVIRRTNIENESDSGLFEVLFEHDTPRFSLEDIIVIMNAKKQKFVIPNRDPVYDTLTKIFKTGHEFQDIIIESKIKNLGYLMEQNIDDDVIRKATSDTIIKLSRKNEIKYDDLNQELDDLINLVGIDASERGDFYLLSGRSYNYTRLQHGDVQHNKILNTINNTHVCETPFDYEAKLFKTEMELDPLKSYLANNALKEPELSKYLYEKFYLKRLSPNVRSICKKISDEFGTKLFVEDTSNPRAAKKIYTELTEWERASKGKFNKPPIIDLSRYNPSYITSNNGGYMRILNREVHIKTDERRPMKWALRHEMTHVNRKGKQTAEIAVNTSGVNEKELQKSDNSAASLILDKSEHSKELFKAGLPNQKIDYAYKNEDEFVAVAAEGDYARYSSPFKEFLVKLGLPEYVFSMKPGNPDFVANAQKRADAKVRC